VDGKGVADSFIARRIDVAPAVAGCRAHRDASAPSRCFETDYRKLRRSCSSDRARVEMRTPLFDRNRNNAHYR